MGLWLAISFFQSPWRSKGQTKPNNALITPRLQGTLPVCLSVCLSCVHAKPILQLGFGLCSIVNQPWYYPTLKRYVCVRLCVLVLPVQSLTHHKPAAALWVFLRADNRAAAQTRYWASGLESALCARVRLNSPPTPACPPARPQGLLSLQIRSFAIRCSSPTWFSLRQ